MVLHFKMGIAVNSVFSFFESGCVFEKVFHVQTDKRQTDNVQLQASSVTRQAFNLRRQASSVKRA